MRLLAGTLEKEKSPRDRIVGDVQGDPTLTHLKLLRDRHLLGWKDFRPA